MKEELLKKENAEIKLQQILDNTSKELSNRVKKMITEEDLKNAKFELVETEIANIISKNKLSISSSDGDIVLPVYLDENFEWYFNRKSVYPLIGLKPELECLKISQPTKSNMHGKLMACYPVENTISEIIENAVTLMKAEIEIFPLTRKDTEFKKLSSKIRNRYQKNRKNEV